MSLKLQCWFYKSEIMFCKTKGSWSSTWKQRFSDSSRGRFFSFPSTDSVCLGGEREAQTCVDRVRLLGKSTYLEGKQCLTKNTASVFTWLIPRWASLHRCFVPTLDQRLMWRLAEVKCYQNSNPAMLGQKTRFSPEACQSQGYWEELETHTRAPESNQPSLSGSQGCWNYSYVSKPFGNVFLVGSDTHFLSLAW